MQKAFWKIIFQKKCLSLQILIPLKSAKIPLLKKILKSFNLDWAIFKFAAYTRQIVAGYTFAMRDTI